MYSAAVTQRQIERVEKSLRIKIHRYGSDVIEDRVESLKAKYAAAVASDASANNKQATQPQWKPEEAAFIRNEQILSKLDYHHFAVNYCKIQLAGINQSGLGTLQLWESQQAILRLMAKLEEESLLALSRNEPCDGILICLNKSRQLGATAVSRSVIVHRCSAWEHVEGFSASVDDDKVMELYVRDKRIYDNLPFFLQPSLDARDGSVDQQGALLKFGKLDSGVLYQTANQKSGLGQGRKFDVSHLTEVASFDADGRGFGMIEHDFLPTIPQSPTTFCILESTPQGRGDGWHVWSEMVRKGRVARWHYLFVPVYIEKKRNRRHPPVDWVPTEHTLKYAAKIEATSPEVVGYKYVPERDFLYWWETMRAELAERGMLNSFLTNYACTPEESFQFSTRAAFDAELLERISMDVVEPVSYEFDRV